MSPSEDHRENDLRALSSLLDLEELSEYERDAFDDMLAPLMAGRYRQLTERQREWVMGRCDVLGIVIGDPAERNKNVPRGREVEAPDILKRLPKAPPRRAI